ncbi:hypothetical protein IW140_004645 [Coemansia sp. RSA 1813]|nr:hypothetical protein EV178_004720 [Coemansia sp. RSA 1646]KAJ1770156.1 hypothetical protein LPJ74_003443 [Coemansia sp. RSA 1843]KAJ2087633.1 hypothetical protein IW138_004836 [Coemansia sp. RSA 986]KAJ2214377.1 hypothetical protein EV179_003042 [Coemansia sp. RSA 487]KAJ2567078.1 hypothetical protein IW140_004645 [Coemansia sp. RSA 1813]
MGAFTEMLLLLLLVACNSTPLLANSTSDCNEQPAYSALDQDICHDGLFRSSRTLYHRAVCLVLALVALINRKRLHVVGTFAYNCFFKRLSRHDSQQQRLNAFYEGQASVYDATRGRLLRGRKTMLRLCAAELEHTAKRVGDSGSGLVWVDVGGGTGWNIEKMDALFGISNFDRVYLVDLCEPLCRVAEQRFKAKGWTNVIVVCQPASSFTLPGIPSLEGSADLVTMSYSLSMLDSFYPVVERLASILKPRTGILGVADFYVSETTETSNNHGFGYHCSWFTRVFWQHWFEFDHVFLHPCRRNYLEHVFATHKVFNGRNHFIIPQIIQIPYYVWLGKRQSSANADGCSLAQSSAIIEKCAVNSSGSDRGWIRLPYRPERPEHAQFTTYIYAFTWEDPRCDLQALDLKPGDNLLVITSAGDNALAYAAHQDQITLHCVDMNPCQNHLLELKLVCLRALEYKQFWQIFGNGRIDGFTDILESKLSPWLSQEAYQYWRNNVDTFGGTQAQAGENRLRRMVVDKLLGPSNLYTTGYSGLALRCLHVMLRLTGTKDAALRLIRNALSLSEQMHVWRQHMRGWVQGTLATWFLDNPVIMWQLLGVPINQWNMLRSEGSMSQYVRDTIEPVLARTSLADDNYFYHLLFALRYSPTCCPDYMTKQGFDKLQRTLSADTPLDQCTFRLHTDTILDVLAMMRPGELTKAVIMDHMDWFSAHDAQQEVSALARAISKDGFVLWRSAARHPWYVKVFEANGFSVEAISVRQPNTMKPLDRVNMYASFYKATKL